MCAKNGSESEQHAHGAIVQPWNDEQGWTVQFADGTFILHDDPTTASFGIPKAWGRREDGGDKWPLTVRTLCDTYQSCPIVSPVLLMSIQRSRVQFLTSTPFNH